MKTAAIVLFIIQLMMFYTAIQSGLTYFTFLPGVICIVLIFILRRKKIKTSEKMVDDDD